jgi:hypothetical protein
MKEKVAGQKSTEKSGRGEIRLSARGQERVLIDQGRRSA